MGYKKGTHPEDSAFSSSYPTSMSYYQWLVGQLARNPKFITYPSSVSETSDDITDNIIRIADKLVEKMENKEK